MPIIIANLKMQLGVGETVDLVKKINQGLEKENIKGEVVVCPSFVALAPASEYLKESGSKIQLGAQDVFWEDKGAFTGEVSPLQLKELGVKYVIVGHSERRENLKEDDKIVHEETKACLHDNLIPIICVGEKFSDRQENSHYLKVMTQVTRALGGLSLVEDQKVIIAYEPVWVIGTGQAIAPQDAQEMHQVIRQSLIDLWHDSKLVKNNFRIIYGGSVDSKNVKSFLDQPNIDGALVGGASLNAEEFVAIIRAASL